MQLTIVVSIFAVLSLITLGNPRSDIVYIDEPVKIQLSQSELASVAFESLARTPATLDKTNPVLLEEKNLLSGVQESIESNQFENPIKISRTELIFNVNTANKERLPFSQDKLKSDDFNRETFKKSFQTHNSKIIRGEIQNSQGLPYGGEYQIRVRQVKNQREISVGEVDAEFGEYRIPFVSLEGEVRAELMDSKGLIIGVDSYKIDQSTINEKNNHFLGRKLVLKPQRQDGLYADAGSVIPKTSHDKTHYDRTFNRSNKQFSNSTEGFMYAEVTQNLSRNSSSLIETRGPASPPTLSLTLASRTPILRSVDNIYLESLIKVIEAQTNSSYIDPNLGVIFGKVTFGSEALMGAKVEVEGFEELAPVYFNTMMPDTNLPATSENGTFIIFNVPTGYFSVKVSVGDQYWSHENVVTREGSVSQVEIRSNLQKNNVDLYAVDAFTHLPVRTQLSTQAAIGDFDIINESKIIIQNQNRESIYKVNARDGYLAHTGYINESQSQIVIPRIREAWLNQMLSTSVVSEKSGVVIGFVEGKKYEVFLPHENNQSAAQLIYFDSSGNRSDESVENGGFVLVNVPADVQSVLVFDKEEELFHSKVLPVDAQSLSVLKFSKSLNF